MMKIWHSVIKLARGRERPGGGFTLLETIFAFTILLLLAVLILSRLSLFQTWADLDRAVNETLGLLREARSKTLGSEGGSEYGVYFTANTITLFRGVSYDPADPVNVVVALPSSVTISDINLATTTASVVFERITGRSPAAGTITFTSNAPASSDRSIEILISGVFRKR